MNSKKYMQSVIPAADLPEEWKGVKIQQLKNIILNHIRIRYAGMVIHNIDTGLPFNSKKAENTIITSRLI